VGSAPPQIRTRAVLGVPFAVTDYEGAMDAIDALIAERRPGYVCALAVHGLMVARRDAEMGEAVVRATLNVPDGMPLVWALRRLGERLEDRVYGPELMLRHCARSAAAGHRVWLLGGRDAPSVEAVAASLRDRYPEIGIVGSGFIPHGVEPTGAEDQELAVRINGDSPDVVWVGLGAPKQEKWMARVRERLNAPALVGVGAAFDFIAGLVPQAPRWMQDRGLEWAYRLSREPRLLPRYARHNPAFLAAFARQLRSERRVR
jgi:N-acetylglucosaminyldiphosphoundecaprenol N-acetyl-beta-D-mannosaminyltransferase